MKNFKDYSFDQVCTAEVMYILIKSMCPNFPDLGEIELQDIDLSLAENSEPVRKRIENTIDQQPLLENQSFVMIFMISPPLTHNTSYRHSVTAFINPARQEIEVHDPLDVNFPLALKNALQNIYPSFNLNENQTCLQKVSESCCRYISAKKVIAYANDLEFPTRESMERDLANDSTIISNAMLNKLKIKLSNGSIRPLFNLRIFARDVKSTIEKNKSVSIDDKQLTLIYSRIENDLAQEIHSKNPVDLHIAFENNYKLYHCEKSRSIPRDNLRAYKDILVSYFTKKFSPLTHKKTSSVAFFKETSEVNQKKDKPNGTQYKK